MEKPLILFHGKRCPDGFGAAWAAWKKFGNKAEYQPLEHNEPPPKDMSNREVYFLDYCYSLPVAKELYQKNSHITVLDHHISQKEAIMAAPRHVYVKNHSGAVLAWNFFHPKKRIPKLLEIVEDMDLFSFNISGTKEYSESFTSMGLFPFSFKKWDTIVRAFEKREYRKKYYLLGKELLKYKEQKLQNLLTSAERVEFEGYQVYAVNTPIYYSEIANLVCTTFKVPFGISWYYRSGRIHVSLRSLGKVDVSKIAVKYGSGGHARAAGFSVPLVGILPWKTIQ